MAALALMPWLVARGASRAWAQEDQGKQAFSDAGCVMCHGPSAKGADGPSLIPMERELLDLVRIVREGLGEMPGQADVSDEQITRVYEFLVRLSGEAAGEPDESGTRASSPPGVGWRPGSPSAR